MSNQSATVKPQAKASQPPAKASRQRWRLLRQLHEIIEGPMAIFAILWLVLVVLEFTRGLNGFLRGCGYALWAIFLVDLGLEFLVAPDRLGYLKRHWLYVISLLIPGIGVLRVFRVLRLVRGGMSLGVLLSSINSSVRTLRVHLKKRGFGYVAVLTLAITLAGAAGMYSFENSRALQNSGARAATGLNSYGDALWWTSMLMTTIGSDYVPQTPPGRALCFLLSIYALGIFGYITATIATLFIGQPGRVAEDTRLAEERVFREKMLAELAELRSAMATRAA